MLIYNFYYLIIHFGVFIGIYTARFTSLSMINQKYPTRDTIGIVVESCIPIQLFIQNMPKLT